VDGLASGCTRAFEIFADRPRLDAMRRAAMLRCFSWSVSAANYAALYRRHCSEAEPQRTARPAVAPRRVEVDLEAAA
jgi:glycogen synthase